MTFPFSPFCATVFEPDLKKIYILTVKLINFLLLIVKFTFFWAPSKFSGPWEKAIFYVCREQKERGIGCAPDPFEPEFLLKNRIFVANIIDY